MILHMFNTPPPFYLYVTYIYTVLHIVKRREKEGKNYNYFLHVQLVMLLSQQLLSVHRSDIWFLQITAHRHNFISLLGSYTKGYSMIKIEHKGFDRLSLAICKNFIIFSSDRDIMLCVATVYYHLKSIVYRFNY